MAPLDRSWKIPNPDFNGMPLFDTLTSQKRYKIDARSLQTTNTQ